MIPANAADTYIVMQIINGGGCYHVDAAHWDEIDAAFGDWIDKRRDHLLAIQLRDGRDFRIGVSQVSAFFLSTPEGRDLEREQSAADKAENPFGSVE